MKQKFLNRACCVGAAALTLLSGMPVYAAENVSETQNVRQDASSEVIINGVDSRFSVTVPKNIAGEGKSGTLVYGVTVEGDIAGNECVNVVPDESVTLSQKNKADIVAGIAQDKTSWYADEFDVAGNGTVTYEGLSAGEWNGAFNFNIELTSTLIPYAFNYPAMGNSAVEDDCIRDFASKLGYEARETESSLYALYDSEGNEIKDLVIPETITVDGREYLLTELPNIATRYLGNITSISIPDSVTTFGTFTLNWSDNLSEITIPSNIKEIGKYSLSNTKISKVTYKGITYTSKSELINALTSNGVTVNNENDWFLRNSGLAE